MCCAAAWRGVVQVNDTILQIVATREGSDSSVLQVIGRDSAGVWQD